MINDSIVDFPMEKLKRQLCLLKEQKGMEMKDVMKKSCRFQIH